MKTQTKEEMIESGATEEEAEKALKLFKLLRPALKINRANGRIETEAGSKTVLGLYRTLRRFYVEEK